MLVDYTMRWINNLGAEWKNQMQFGSHKILASEFYQPLEHSRTLFVAPRVIWDQQFIDLYQGDKIVAEYRVRKAVGGLDFGIQPWSYGELRLGLEAGTATQLSIGATCHCPGVMSNLVHSGAGWS
jgi:NTE family protein